MLESLKIFTFKKMESENIQLFFSSLKKKMTQTNRFEWHNNLAVYN